MTATERDRLRELIDAARREQVERVTVCRACGVEKLRGESCGICAIRPRLTREGRPTLSADELRERRRLRKRAYRQTPAGRAGRVRENAKRDRRAVKSG